MRLPAPIATLAGFGLFATVLLGRLEIAAAELQAGVARVDITNDAAGPVHDRLYAKALVLRNHERTVVLITIDAVAIGEIGPVRNDFLPTLRAALKDQLAIPPQNVLVNASHCHGIVRDDVAALTIDAVRKAVRALAPVRVGAGEGKEDRISSNRRFQLVDGRETDERHAYAMPRDEDIAGVGPIDPKIGLLRIDRLDGRPLAVVYQFACHPIQGSPTGGNTADFPGFASKAIEESLGHGVVALFVQGCAGDINPVFYKQTHSPRDAEPLGNRLGLSVLRDRNAIEVKDETPLLSLNETLTLPRGVDIEHRIKRLEEEEARLVKSLHGTSLNFKEFLPLLIQRKLAGEFPSAYKSRYLHEQALGRDELGRLDADNAANVEAYLANIDTMERLTRCQINLALLRKHWAQHQEAGKDTLDVEIAAIRVGDFTLVTFPGELTVEVGLQIQKKLARPLTYVSGYTNGYIYYAPTEAQRNNPGYAQEDCDVLVGPKWQEMFEAKALELLRKL